jgi:hypothetical protein
LHIENWANNYQWPVVDYGRVALLNEPWPGFGHADFPRYVGVFPAERKAHHFSVVEKAKEFAVSASRSSS